MSGPRLIDRFYTSVTEQSALKRPCVVKDRQPDAAGRALWWAVRDPDDGDYDVGFNTHAEAIAWLDRRVRSAE